MRHAELRTDSRSQETRRQNRRTMAREAEGGEHQQEAQPRIPRQRYAFHTAIRPDSRH